MKRKALFLDRDGVINVDYGYVHRQQDCVFVDGIFDLVRLANATGHQVVVVTNQAGIGRGYFSESQFVAFMDWMRRRFDERGARIDRVYFCPHHPVAGMGRYRQACACRKPQPGMLHDARRDLGLDLSASILVGDKRSDLDAGARAGVGRRFLFVGDRAGDADADPSAEVVARLADIGAALQGRGIAAMRA
ncbi:D,D-heptose 1,7-bisphosphate phosphatase [Burkholderia cepacia JBK9]|uniref:D,D-heptose 1,7-bisphosphate phosphatase n=1 Tax=Burkholderia arboris TaxID=488730 RepID=A0ABZ3DMA6_9BURK|nr:D-glycero-beta-D-manno-heptose 1,7-bisphosphate 7-phosphatase [Burkholderia arboris]ALX13456.1 D,D-heptose 1,7-bisphosphate phosphatase [Burkholderia cepacia JBK9]MCA8488914.1 D-glycero-beta-D-manno-heptose 1,7-bisphosphate 7-phosphatase [Burkholderia arboris]UTV57703.1 D-glycero-beta-D-manno-heptose 1,7-bisphosphate 7-phosphatase [Burkholderia arboris]